MVRVFRLLLRFLLKRIGKLIDLFILSLPIYYTRMDKISIARWYDIINGDLISLYKIELFKRIPYLFLKIVENMWFQLDRVDMTMINKEAEIAILYSQAARLKNKSKKFLADEMNRKLDIKKSELAKKNKQKLNDFLNYIELTLDKTVDPEKTSASRAYSLWFLAVEKNKQVEKRNKLAHGRNTK